jgi:PII-like signaling protein
LAFSQEAAMKGFQITFFTQQDRKHQGSPLAEWLLECAHRHGVSTATLKAGSVSYDNSGRFHSSHFFELADQPVEVTVVADETSAEKLLAALEQEAIAVFYVKTAIEFGLLGRAAH